MKRILSFALAILFVTGLAYGHSVMVNPEDGDGTYVTVPVYNNSGGTLDAGDVVIWDIDSSTGDDDFWVTTTTTADTHVVAGVIWPRDITDANVGSMAIWGIVQCDADNPVVDGALCTGTTAGQADACATDNTEHRVAIATEASAGASQVDCFVGK